MDNQEIVWVNAVVIENGGIVIFLLLLRCWACLKASDQFYIHLWQLAWSCWNRHWINWHFSDVILFYAFLYTGTDDDKQWCISAKQIPLVKCTCVPSNASHSKQISCITRYFILDWFLFSANAEIWPELKAATYGFGHSPLGMLWSLTAYRLT